MKRSAFIGIVVFAIVVALGSFLLGPAICGDGWLGKTFGSGDRCTGPGAASSSLGVLIYFAAVALALLVATAVEKLRPAIFITASRDADETSAPAADVVVAEPALPAIEKTSSDSATVAPASPLPQAEDIAFAMKYRELAKAEGPDAIEWMQEHIDRSTLDAITNGHDPKLYLSRIAAFVIQQEVELKSDLAQKTIRHVTVRLRELGVELPGKAESGAV